MSEWWNVDYSEQNVFVGWRRQSVLK